MFILIFSFSFISVKPTCQAYKESGYVRACDYMVDPDGLGEGAALVRAYCDMTGKNGLAGTQIGHDSEGRTLVNGLEKPKSYARDIHYNIGMAQIIALIDFSLNCEQFISYDCHNSMINNDRNFASWTSRQGVDMTHWGGAVQGSGKCACGMTKSCDRLDKVCNCDANDNVWRSDHGFITDKDVLPVSKLYFGDTGGTNEKGYHTLGRLICYGKKV